MRLAAATSAMLTLGGLQWGSASLIEATWTLTGLVGIYLTANNLRDARRYITAIGRAYEQVTVTDEMRIIAFGHYRNELLRLWMFLVVCGIGIVAMITPPSNRHQPVTPVGIAITLGLFTITAALVLASFLDRRQRDLLINLEGHT